MTKEMDSDMSERLKEKDRDRKFGEVEGKNSVEEEDSIRRSTKKKKGSHLPRSEEPGMETMGGSEPGSPIGPSSRISYKESLLGTIPGAYERAFFGSNMEEDEFYSSDEEDEPPAEGEVVIKFSSELKRRIRAPWTASLIVKVFGRSVGYMFLVNKLKAIWKTNNGFSCVDLGLGFFLIKFENRDDFEDVLRNGPWFIGENFLSIRPWVPDFRASDASVSSVAVWVRLPELPVEYYHKDSLMHIGSGIGPVLRVDFNTASGARGRFARLCLQLDLDKPLIRTVRVGKLKLAVVYEGIGLLCFKCGKLGHKQEWCPAGGTAESSVPHESAPATSTPEENSNGFGPWMLVTRRKRQTKSVSQQVVVDTAERGRTIAVHNVPSVEVQVGDDGTAAIKVDNYPTRGKEQGKGKETKLLAGGASQKVLKGQGGPPKTNRGPRSIVTPPTQNLNSLQSSIPSPYIHLEKPKELNFPVAPSAAPNTSTSSLPHTELISHSISLRPHTPSSSSRNDKHQVGLNTDPQGSAQLVNPSQRENHSSHGGYYRPHSEGPSPCLGMVQREPNTRLGRDHSSSPTNRLSRTPSPNRFGMASGSQPVLEFHDGYTANRRDPLSFEDSFTAVAGAPIKAISGGGVQCNTNRVRREESITITPTLPRMEGECILDQTSSDSKVCTQIRDSDQKFRIEGSGFSSLPFQDGSTHEHYLGNMAREGLEFAGSGRKLVPDS
jgi:hypothetical protein